MTTIITHAALPLCAALGLGRDVIPARLMWLGVFVSILPDFDVIGFKFGVAYASQFGHRGLSHSLLLAIFIGLIATFFHANLRSTRLKIFVFVTLSMASHAALDMLTNGGLGVAFFWPLTDTRYFL
jgi:inner membrane protein